MKYIRYVSILVWTLIRKVVGILWYYFAVPFRKYANNTVFNYVLKNSIYLKRLNEKDISLEGHYYIISPSHGTVGGKIKYRDVGTTEYFFVYWFIWGWLDADSYCDTTSESFLNEWQDGNRGIINNAKCLSKCTGNAFDRGDDIPSNFCLLMSSLWNIRNTAYNFKYMQWEENRPKYLFYHTFYSYHFGYLPTGKNEGRLVFGAF